VAFRRHVKTLSRQHVRELDARAASEYGLSGLVLMENAGRGATDLLCQLGANGQVAICCGKGNNGGDGFVIARHLDVRQVSVAVFLFSDPMALTGDAAVNYRILEKCGIPIRVFAADFDDGVLLAALSSASWIVDALLGTGASGDPRPPIDRVINAINASGKPILAIDLPSGLDCDTGRPGNPTIRALHTCTFVAAKPGFFAPGAAAFTGELHIADIGAPRKLIEEMLREQSVSPPR